MIARLSLMAVLLTSLQILPARAADTPVIRTPLQSADAPETAHSVQSYLVTVAPKASIARHTHPGIEMGYCLSGVTIVSVAGQPDRVVKAGDSWAFPAGVPHGVVNGGDVPAQLLVTYVVDKNKPLSSPTP